MNDLGATGLIVKIVSNARKLIFEPPSDAPVVSFPKGANVNEEYSADHETPSVIVLNGSEDEPSWQGVSHAKGMVIINEVPESVAHMALDLFDKGGRTNESLLRALHYLACAGFVDQYTTSHSFRKENLTPAGRMLSENTGIVKRDARDLISVWQKDGTIFVLTDGVRDIEPGVLLRTYRMPDGSEIEFSKIPNDPPKGIEG